MIRVLVCRRRMGFTLELIWCPFVYTVPFSFEIGLACPFCVRKRYFKYLYNCFFCAFPVIERIIVLYNHYSSIIFLVGRCIIPWIHRFIFSLAGCRAGSDDNVTRVTIKPDIGSCGSTLVDFSYKPPSALPFATPIF